MKKSLIALPIIAFLASGTAHAKTQGHYIGFSLINTNLKSAAYLNDVKEDEGQADKFSGGVGYKYAFNFDGFFIAPEIFYDFNNTKSRSVDTGGTQYNSELKNSYGIKLNLGYDFTDKFSAYGIVGHSISKLKSRFAGNLSGGVDPTPENHNEESLIYGLGVKYDVSNRVSLNFSYEMSQFYHGKSFGSVVGNLDPDYQIARLGVSYNF